MRSARAFLIGAGTAYFLDPRQGRRRRNVLRDSALWFGRRGSRLGVMKARFAGGHLRGLMAVGRHGVWRSPVAGDDDTIAQRIRSDALRDVGVSTRNVQVEVKDGVATLRGTVGSRSLADGLVSRVSKVPGVRDVAAMIRVTNGDVP